MNAVMPFADLPSVISPEERVCREREVSFARGSVRYAGGILSDEIEVLNDRYIAGHITTDELTAAILASDTVRTVSLIQHEATLTFGRIREIHRHPVQGRFDVAHLREVHRRIFQDLLDYDPGEFRPDAPEDLNSHEMETTGERIVVRYASRSEIDQKLFATLGALQGGKALRDFNLLEMSEAFSQVHALLDYLHPFRRGNGRTLRTFTEQLARETGHRLDWGTANVTPRSRDAFHIARSMAVMRLYDLSTG